MVDKEKEDKYAVVADGEVVDTEPTKASARKVAKEYKDEAEKVEVVPVEEVAEATSKSSGTDSQGIKHLR